MSDLEKWGAQLELLRARDEHTAGCDHCQAARAQAFWDHREILALRGYITALEARLERQNPAGPQTDRGEAHLMKIIRPATEDEVRAALPTEHVIPETCVICGKLTTTFASAVQKDGSVSYFCAECMA